MENRMKLFAIALGIVLVSCGHSAEPTYYALSPSAGSTRSGFASRVKVLRVGLSGYLDRQSIVLRIQDNRLELAGGEHWAEPLGSMLTRVVVEDLAERAPNASVFWEGAVLDIPADIIVAITVEHFELEGDRAILQAQIAVQQQTGNPLMPLRVRLAEKPNAPTLSATIDANNVLLGRLADTIVQMLARAH